VEQKRLAWKHCSSNTQGLKKYAGDDDGQGIHSSVWMMLHGLSPFEREVLYLLQRLDPILKEIPFDEYASLKSKKQPLSNEYMLIPGPLLLAVEQNAITEWSRGKGEAGN